MSRNGSGVQTSPGASFPAVAATLIESAKFNSIINDINTSITQSIASDGQTPITANLPMGGFKHTGAAAAVGSGEYAEYAQMNTAIAAGVATEVTNRNTAIATSEQTQLYTAFTTTGTSTAYVATPSPAIATPASNARLRLKFHLASGATPTLTVGTVTAALQQYDGTGTLIAATLGLNQLADVEYNGTVYVVLMPLGFTQSAGDARYAKLAGLNTQVFNVANAASANNAVALGQYAFSNVSNNWSVTLPNGIIIKWGKYSYAGVHGSSYTPSFNTAFPTACFTVVNATTNGAIDITTSVTLIRITALAAGSFTFQHGWTAGGTAATEIYWFAIGN
jgi:hypothetical protein